jgi:hypothetical protein
VAVNENALGVCLDCIKRDPCAVLWLCSVCGNERLMPREAWLEEDYRCVPCQARCDRELDEAAEHAWRNR